MAVAQAAEFAAAAGTKPFEAKKEKARGRMLGIGQLAGARAFVDAKLESSKYRDQDEFMNAPWDYDEEPLGEDEVDTFVRQPGRGGGGGGGGGDHNAGGSVDQPAIPGGSKAGYQYNPPHSGDEMLHWRVQCTFPTGPEKEFRWHPGIIIQVRIEIHDGSQQPMYRVYFPIDSGDEWLRGSELPHKGVCFRKPHLSLPKATAEEVQKVARALGEPALLRGFGAGPS